MNHGYAGYNLVLIAFSVTFMLSARHPILLMSEMSLCRLYLCVMRLYDIIMKRFNVFACLCSKLSYGFWLVIGGGKGPSSTRNIITASK